MIPKIVHQIYWDFDKPEVTEPPAQWARFSSGLQASLPDWHYVRWDKQMCVALLKQKYPWFLERFNAYPYPVMQADGIRPFILYTYGGVYIDMDFTCVRRFDDLLGNGISLLPRFDVRKLPSAHLRGAFTKSFTNSFIGSPAGHPFWHLVFEGLLNASWDWLYYISKHFYIMQSTGPGLLTRCARQYGGDDIHVLSLDALNPCDVCTPQCEKSDEVRCYTTHASSWHGADSQLINIFQCNVKTLCLLWIVIVTVLFFMLLQKCHVQYPNVSVII